MKGKLIVIEGLDGSGKATQTKLLCESLRSKGINVRKVSFPDYSSDSSALVKMYLNGEFGTNANDVNAYAASSFYAVDRYASYKKDWGGFYESGGLVIADRYTTSNAIHQCSKLPDNEWDRYIQWLFDFEYRLLGLPEPAAVLFLKADVDIEQRLMSDRYNGDEDKKDIHEKDLNYLKRSQAAAIYCAEKLGWSVIECLKNENMRSIDDIHSQVESMTLALIENSSSF
jgi:dTMP kinase